MSIYLTPPPTRRPSVLPKSTFTSPNRYKLAHPIITHWTSSVPADDDDEAKSPNPRSKRRRANNGKSVDPSPNKAHLLNPPSPPPRRSGNLAPIKPIGFAASRESRKEGGGVEPSIPSPVVMGFDFKAIDEEQLKTVSRRALLGDKGDAEDVNAQVRNTISIKEQQQALIAARRREVAASTPSTPKELTFKGWTPKEDVKVGTGSAASGGVGRRREKTRDKVEKLSIVTTGDKEVGMASKSAPLNQGLAIQQTSSPRDPPSGSQTSVPPHIMPPHSTYPPQDPRTAPISHTRTRNGEENEFARQQTGGHGYYPRSSINVPSLPQSGRPPTTADRRNFTAPSTNANRNFEYHQPPPHQHGYPHSRSDSPTSPPPPRRESFLQPFNQLYDLLHTTDNLRFTLQDLLHRYEGAFASQLAGVNEFKSTANQASVLLGTLQQSAESLKEMVRYEVERRNEGNKTELDELKERIRVLEARERSSNQATGVEQEKAGEQVGEKDIEAVGEAQEDAVAAPAGPVEDK
ncbi:hypothetical protein P7C73_g5063, partial [Tremellales sp. Uapishka_1]